MEAEKELLLQALRASLQKQTVDWEREMTPEQWHQLFSAAAAHGILPMIYEAVIRSSAARKADRQIFAEVKKETFQLVMLQAVKTDAFLKLLKNVGETGATPLVVKGIVCRELYPNPDHRMSGDEDLLIPEAYFPFCHEAMLANGMVLADPEQDLGDYEVSYRQKEGPLHIELHKQLFAPDSDAYGELNRFFAGVHDRAVIQTLQGVPVRTMDHTDHLLYLLCHAFKHFLHGGFGIRQVCDICLYANRFGPQIDWQRLRTCCEELHGELFAAALFRIGEKHLTFCPDAACYPQQWRVLEVDERAMLEDLLAAGIFGASTMSRKHSSNMTLNAVSERKQGRKGGSGLVKTLFPSGKDLSGRYPYLKEKPYLLPVAWADRIVKYRQETAKGSRGNNAAESIRIGNKRIDLLKQYGLID